MTATSPANAVAAAILHLGGDPTVHRLGYGAMGVTSRPTNGGPEHLRAACEGSRPRLRIDQIPVHPQDDAAITRRQATP